MKLHVLKFVRMTWGVSCVHDVISLNAELRLVLERKSGSVVEYRPINNETGEVRVQTLLLVYGIFQLEQFFDERR